MFEKELKKLKKLLNKVQGNKSTADSADDDILKELGLDDASLLIKDEKGKEKGVDFIDQEDKNRKILKEKSLLLLSYVFFGITILIALGGSTILFMSNSTQEEISQELNDEKTLLTTQVGNMRTQLEELDHKKTTNIEVDPQEFYRSIYQDRYTMSYIIEEFDSFISSMRKNENIYIDIISTDILPKENSLKINGNTNSYTNLGKIIENFNKEDNIFSGASIQGATKTISADGIVEVPFMFSLTLTHGSETESSEENLQS